MSLYDSCLAAKSIARVSQRNILAWLRSLEVWSFRVMPAATAGAPIVDGCCAVGVAAVGAAAAAADERSPF